MRSSTIGSLLSVVLAIGAVLHRSGLNYGVDFRGGTLILAATPEAHAIREIIAAALNKLNVGDVGVTEISDTSGADRHMVLMRLGVTSSDAKARGPVVKNLQTALSTEFTGIEFLQVDNVGSKVSSELVRSGIVAVILSFLSIMVYVWLRFEWQFAVGAVLSLVHDTAVADRGLLHLSARVRPDHRGGDPDHHRLFDQRHGGGVRPRARKPAQVQEDAAAGR